MAEGDVKINPFGVVSTAFQFGKGIYDLFDKVKKDREADKIYRNTKRPVYNRQSEIDDVYNIAGSEVNNTALVDSMERQAGQGLSAGIDAVLKSGDGADFSTIYNSYGNSLNQALQIQQQDRARKIAAYNNSAYNLAKAKDTEFQYNRAAPYADKMQQAALLKSQGAKAGADAFTNFSGAFANLGTMTEKPGQYGRSNNQNTVPTAGVDSTGMAQQPMGNNNMPVIDYSFDINEYIQPPQEESYVPTEQDELLNFWQNYRKI